VAPSTARPDGARGSERGCAGHGRAAPLVAVDLQRHLEGRVLGSEPRGQVVVDPDELVVTGHLPGDGDPQPSVLLALTRQLPRRVRRDGSAELRRGVDPERVQFGEEAGIEPHRQAGGRRAIGVQGDGRHHLHPASGEEQQHHGQ
jgi:hypothetical protein